MAETPESTDGFHPEAYRAVFHASPDGIVITDRRGRIRDVNPRAEELFQYAAEEMLGEPVELLVPDGARPEHESHRERYLERPTRRPMGVGLELRGRRKDGTEFPVEISLSPFTVDGEKLVVATVRDLTERRQLRRFGTETLRAAEEERRKLARELHDDTAQRLAAALLRIQMIRRSAEGEDRSSQALDDLRQELLETAEGVRRIARGLRPPALEDVGLLAAIRSHVRATSRAACAEIQLDASLDDSLGRQLEEDEKLVFYRVIQEALSNAVRHAEAETVSVRIFENGDVLVGEVEDDGTGFEVEGLEAADAGLGLIGMKERTASVDGTFRLESDPGRGTRVRVEIPLAMEGAIRA